MAALNAGRGEPTPNPAPPSSADFTLGDLVCAARHAHREFRHQDRLERHLGWPHRRVLWIEHNRIRPSADQLAQLTAALPILRLLLERVHPAWRESRDIETVGSL